MALILEMIMMMLKMSLWNQISLLFLQNFKP
jgi:hypothetical protein